jgi:hypothetical protein
LGLGYLSNSPGDVLNFGTGLQIDSYDVELTQSCGGENWTCLVAGGVRYARLSQQYFTQETPLGNPAAYDLVSSGHSFAGVGPTLAFEVRRRLCNSCVGVYGNGRGALLWGESGQCVYEVSNGNLPADMAVTCRDSLLSVAELEVGAEICKDCGHFQWFLRAGLVGQAWFGAGNSSNNGDIVNTSNNWRNVDNNSTLGLFGLSVSAGLNF